jgi:hypothetical protein
VPGTRFTLEFSLAEASNKEFLRKLPSKAADVQCRKDVIDRPIADKERIILSESLFTVAGDDPEIGDIKRALGSILNKPGSHIEILPADEIMRCVRRDGSASRDKVAVILSSEDTKPGSAWRDAGKTESIKATVLTVGDKLTGANYLYLTGLIGFTRAVMTGERNKIERYYKLLTGTVMEVNALALLDIAGSNNTIPFALNTILKFRPIEKIDPAVLDSLRLAMENFLISA